MKNIVCVLFAGLLILSSCKKESTAVSEVSDVPVSDSVYVGNDTAVVATPAVVQNSAMDANGGNPNTIMRQNTGSATSQIPVGVQQVPQPAQVGKGMNPAHGQAGHRCDIAVGASLSTPIAKPAAVTKSTQAVTTSTTPTTIPNSPLSFNTDGKSTITTSTPTTPVVTAPGMNPPHGQDGHVCAVAVGAPLPKP